jgi:NADPH-dependent glutamate synthase beta subunit-like oxidoreductase/NAD-dependent dihydropyrimidine dehydrogenase PreA subunit
MPEMSKAVIPPRMGDKKPNPDLLKLGKKITDIAPHMIKGVTSDDPEYWGLADLLSDEEIKVALTMKRRKHYTFAQMCKLNSCKTEEEKAHLQELLDSMSYVGLLEYDYGDHYDHNGRTAPQSERRYCLPMFVPGSAELVNMEEGPEGNKRLREHPEVASFFERMTFLPLDGITHLVPPGGAGIGMHVIPVEKAIEMENESVDLERLSYWLKKYEGHIGVGQCSCRVSRAVLEEGCGDDPQSWCIGVGDFADYCRETGKGHDITYEEAMEILRKAEDNGFVHQITNIDGENKIFGICNCNVNICNALRTSQLFNTPNMSRSAYTARVESKDCTACGKCVEYCPSGAVKLGQKLCTKDGEVPAYPKMVLPDDVHWGRDKYDEDYRDNNRKNCYDAGTAPCKTACPAHVSVQGYLKMASHGRYQDALALIKKDNPFPAICGRVCNKRCEDNCTRGTIDAPVSIDAVKKFIAELDLKAETRYIPKVVIPSSVKTQFDQKIAIIGAGPAGLSAAFYLAQKGYKPVVFEKDARPGGMLTYGIPSFVLEKDVIEAEIDVIRAMGVEIKTGVEVGKDITIRQLRDQGYKAFLIAIGLQAGRRPGIPNDTAGNTWSAVDFLHKATEEQTRKLDGDVVIIGGGNVAVDAARTARRFNPDSVTMFSLEERAAMPANNSEIAETLAEGIEIRNEGSGWGPKEVLVDGKGDVKGLVLKKCLRTIDPETKRFSPVYDEDTTIEVPCKHIVFAVGQGIEWGSLLDGEDVEFQRGSYPAADRLTYQTRVPDIFVSGEAFSGPGFAIEAIECGKNAATSLHRFVQPGTSLTIGRNRRDFIMLDKDNLAAVEDYDHAGRQEEPFDPAVDKPNSFSDPRRTLTEEQVKIETARCFGCGASAVDENKCVGCGVCTTKCEFEAIKLHRTHPECTHMVTAEDKFKEIIPYAIKRGLHVTFGHKTPEMKAAEKAHKEARKADK